jgi:hypothetical protein
MRQVSEILRNHPMTEAGDALQKTVEFRPVGKANTNQERFRAKYRADKDVLLKTLSALPPGHEVPYAVLKEIIGGLDPRELVATS